MDAVVSVRKAVAPDFRLSFENRPGFLFARVTGERDSFKISMDFWSRIARECERVNAKKVLVLEELKEVVSVTDVYRICCEIPKLGFNGVVIAFVDLELSHLEINAFGELVANNRGLFIKTFNDLHAAEQWLLAR